MPGTMSQADLVADLKESLHDTADVFASTGDPAFIRFLNQALPAMQCKRPVTRLGQVSLVVDQPSYSLAAYADFATFKTHAWDSVRTVLKPWDTGYPGAVPRVRAHRDLDAWYLVFDPAPNSAQVAAWGAAFKFWYFGTHTIGATAPETTVALADRGLLLLRAQVEAMRELALQHANKPVSMRDGLSGTPRNSTPAALHRELLNLFEETR